MHSTIARMLVDGDLRQVGLVSMTPIKDGGVLTMGMTSGEVSEEESDDEQEDPPSSSRKLGDVQDSEPETNKEVRQRMPRALGPAGELIPFSEQLARGQQLLTDFTLASSSSRVRALSEGRFTGQVRMSSRGACTVGPHCVRDRRCGCSKWYW